MKTKELEEFIEKIKIIADILKTRSDEEVYELEVLKGNYCSLYVTKEYDNLFDEEKRHLCFNELFSRHDYTWGYSNRAYNYFFMNCVSPYMIVDSDFYYYEDSQIFKLDFLIWKTRLLYKDSFIYHSFLAGLNKNRYLLMKYVLYLKYTYPNYLGQLDNFILQEV